MDEVLDFLRGKGNGELINIRRGLLNDSCTISFIGCGVKEELRLMARAGTLAAVTDIVLEERGYYVDDN